MGMKNKHSKQLKRNRAKREAEKLKREPDIEFDTSAYVIYNRLEMTYPCLSFDIVKDDQPQDVTKFPLSLHMIAGAQTPAHVENNYIYVMKVDGIKALKQEDEEKEEDEEESDEDENNQSDIPNLTSVRVVHKGCVNRLRVNKLSGKTLTASWSDKGKVYIYDLTTSVQAVADQRSIKTYTAQKVEPKPTFTFGGHLTEGYAVDWSRIRTGSLATGDCKKNIHVWTMRVGDWNIDQHPLVGHEQSVEDIKWSPEDTEVLASCSVDKSLRIWDLREQSSSRCVVKVLDSHKSDVNVIDWNTKCKNLLVSGGDDGCVKVWDLRFLKKANKEKETPFPVAQFDYHKKPITSVQWNPHDDTVMAVSSDDDKLTLWDLAVEKDEEQEHADAMEVDDKKSIKSSSSSSDEEVDDDQNGEMDDEDLKDDEDQNDDDDEEEDEEEEEDKDADEGVEYGDLDFKKIPEQMLFLHQGQVEIKELHWHPQLNGLLLSTALNGINIFKTISA